MIAVDGGHVQRRQRRLVEVDDGVRVAHAIGRDRLQRQHVVDAIFAGHGQAGRVHFLQATKAGLGVVFVGGGREAADGRVDLAVAMTRSRVVVHAVVGDAQAELIDRVPFRADTVGVDVLVVVLLAGGQVGPEAVTAVAGIGTADAEGRRQRQGAADQIVLLVVRTELGASHKGRFRAKRLGHVLDGAADGVAAVERALRAAQHFDAADVEDVEHRTLRASDIDVVNIEAHAGLEAPQRILLADAADEGDQRRVRTTGDLDRRVRRLLLQGGDVAGTRALETFGAQGRHRDRHIFQGFVAAACGDDDVVKGGRAFLRDGVLRHGEGRKRAPGGSGQQGGLYVAIHEYPRSNDFQPETLLFSVQ